MLAVLEDAVLTYLRGLHLGPETAAWLEADDFTWPYSFANLCEGSASIATPSAPRCDGSASGAAGWPPRGNRPETSSRVGVGPQESPSSEGASAVPRPAKPARQERNPRIDDSEAETCHRLGEHPPSRSVAALPAAARRSPDPTSRG